MKRLNNVHVIMIDIDGTIKDLAKENTDALINTMKSMDRVDLKNRGKFVLWINKISTYFIKTGFLPTNRIMQNALFFLYSILLGKNYRALKKIYFKDYNRKDIFFDDIEKEFDKIFSNDKQVYLVSKNIQNKSILKYPFLKRVTRLVIGKSRRLKYFVYRNLIGKLGIDKKEILIVGDNFWDDVLPALVLGVNVVWCNMYNSKLKKIVINILSTITHRVISCDRINHN